MAAQTDERLRHVTGVVGPLLLVVVAAWAYAALPSATVLYGRAAAARPMVTSAGLKESPTPTASATPTAPRLSAPAPTSSRATAGTTGPGVTEPGVRISTTTTPVGTLEVSERVLLRTAIGRLELAPPHLTRAGDQFGASSPRVTQMQLTVGGQPLALSSDVLRAPRSIDLWMPIHTYEVRYVLVGALVRSAPSKAGRALAALAPVSRSLPSPSPVVVVTRGDAILNISCPLLTGNAVACSDGIRGEMSVRAALPLQSALVILQLDLPRP